MLHRTTSMLVIPIVVLLTTAFTGSVSPVTLAQDDGFDLVASAAFCEPGYQGPFVGCTAWDGVSISFASADGIFSESCVTSSPADGRAASCTVVVPFGSTIVASIDPSDVPDGFSLEGATTQTFEIPDGPPDGIYSGPSFVLLPEGGSGETPPGYFALQADAAFCEPGYLGPFQGCTPWDGVTVTFATPNGAFEQTCTTASTGGTTATCSIDVPVITTIIASIDPSTIPAGYVLEGAASQTFEIPRAPDGQFGGPSFVLLPDVAATPVAGFPLGALAASCDPGYAYPFVGCSPWDGATIRFVATYGSFTGSCTTSSAGGTTSGCGVTVPFGSTIVATVDLDDIPDGFKVEGETTQQFDIPDGPPDGEFAGPVFVLLPDDRGEVYYPSPVVDAPKVPLVASAAFCEPGYLGPFVGCTPWNDVVVTFTSDDGVFNESCTTSGAADARAASCTVEVPVLTTITASIDPAIIPAGYVLEGDSAQTLDIPVGPLQGQLNNPSFVLLPEDAVDETDGIGLVTQLPVTGAGDAVTPEALSPIVVMLVAAAIISISGVISIRRMQ